MEELVAHMACQKSKQLKQFSRGSSGAANLAAAPCAVWPWNFIVTLLCVYLIPISGVALNLEGALSSAFCIQWVVCLVVRLFPIGLAFQLCQARDNLSCALRCMELFDN